MAAPLLCWCGWLWQEEVGQDGSVMFLLWLGSRLRQPVAVSPTSPPSWLMAHSSSRVLLGWSPGRGIFAARAVLNN
jgi:hypothetical protein